MKGNQVLSDEALNKIEVAIKTGKNWLVFSTEPYFLEASDIHCFSSHELANDYNTYVEEEGESIILPINSLEEVMRFTSGQLLNETFLNTTVMNEKNLSYLQDNLKYLGFGEAAIEALTSQMKEGQPAISISYHASFHQQQMEATLHFKKSEQSGMYFFNKYDATLKHASDPTKDRKASFYINKGTGVSLKEAFNLLNGRAIYKDFTSKEGQHYHAWIQLDLKHKDTNGQYNVNMYHERYGFDLDKALGALPVKELKDPEQKEALLKSLQKGNLQAVSFLTETGQEKRFIEAAPQFKTINQYDERFHPIVHHLAQKQQPGTTQSEKGRINNVAEPGEEPTKSEIKDKRKKKGLSI